MRAAERLILWLIFAISIVSLGLNIAILSKVEGPVAPKKAERRELPPVQPEPQNVTITLEDNDPVKGDPNAPVIIVEFSDFQCPFCRRFAMQTLPLIKEKYIDTGKAKLIFMDLPLPFHQYAKDAAKAANCAMRQGKYWEMHDKLFETGLLTPDDVKSHAKELKLDVNKFEECLKDPSVEDEINGDIRVANEVGINGTPSFIIGKNKGGKVFTGEVVRGALPFSNFQQVIEKYL